MPITWPCARSTLGCVRSQRQVGRRAIAGDGLREAEVEHLDDAVRGDLDVGGLQVAVDDRFFVGHFEGICDLARDVQGLTNGQPLAPFASFSASVSPWTSSRMRKRTPSASSTP